MCVYMDKYNKIEEISRDGKTKEYTNKTSTDKMVLHGFNLTSYF